MKNLILSMLLVGVAVAAPAVKFPTIKSSDLSTYGAMSHPGIRFFYGAAGGAHITNPNMIGRLLLPAIASYNGERSTDAALQKQLIELTKGTHCPSGQGGYSTQFETVLLTAILLAKNTPQVWGKFTDDEKKKFDTLVKAVFAGTAYVSSDETNQPGAKNFTFDGATINNRTSHPRAGLTGNLVAAVCYLGDKEAQDFLKGYDHAKFCEEIQAAGMDNTHHIFSFKANNPDSKGPDNTTIESAVQNYLFFGKDLTDSMNIYLETATSTYSKMVSAGLNNGQGIDGGGKLDAGADKLPNKDKKGMILGFEGYDAAGQTSSADSAYSAFRPHVATQIALIVGGKFDYKNSDWKNHIFPAIQIGNADLFYKLENGYTAYANGKPADKPTTMDGSGDKEAMKFIWESILLPYHKSNTK